MQPKGAAAVQRKKRIPEQQLSELQRGFSRPATDNSDLRQPFEPNYESGRARNEQRYATETYTTYGVYEDAI